MKSMTNMKVLLRLLGATVLTTVAATSVVACGKAKTNTAMSAQVSQNLGLTDTNGKGLIKASINGTTPATPVWKTSIVVANLAKNLVTGTAGQVPGKDADSTAFLKDVLKLTADANGAFAFADVNNIVVKALNITPTITANAAKTDYIVAGGSYTLQFFAADGTTQLGADYTVDLAMGLDTEGLVNASIPTLTIADFNIVGSPIANFVSGTVVVDLVGKTTTLVTATPSTVNVQMVALMKLLGKNAVYTVSAQSIVPDATKVWAAADTLTLKITTTEITAGFTTLVTLTLA